MYGAKVLPFGCAHFVTGGGRASRGIGEQGDDNGIGLLDQEAAKLVKPDLFGSVVRRVGELACELSSYRSRSLVGWVREGVV